MSRPPAPSAEWPAPRARLLYPLYALSGASGLIFQVLWLKQLAVLFGNTAHATATTLTVFFLGLAAGGWFWGARTATIRRPLRAYALLEGGVAVSALAFFGLLVLYRQAYAPLVGAIGHGTALVVAKVLLAGGVLFAPAFFMGGTFPVLAQGLIRTPERAGMWGSLLYAINTVGATVGAGLAGFYLPQAVGYVNAYWIAIALAVAAGVGAFAIDAAAPRATVRQTAASRASDRPERRHPASDAPVGASLATLAPWLAAAVAFGSGFTGLGLEVLWTRLLAQVLNNSVYAFAAILVVFLAALAAGSLLAHVLTRRQVRIDTGLATLLALAGVAVLVTPLVFARMTHGLSYVREGPTWAAYVRSVFVAAGVLMLVPGVLMGSILPYLFRTLERGDGDSGRALGRLVALNSLGAITGALGAGFVLLDTVGLWSALQVMAAVYLMLATAVLVHVRTLPVAARVALPAAFGALLLVTGGRAVPTVRLGAGEQLVKVWEGSSGTVAVVRDPAGLVLRMNNHYVLGDARSAVVEQMQGHLPLLLHPDPRTVFFLGLGTGISAGAALTHPVQQVVATELVPDVITAARAHFAPFTNGLFADPRVRVLAEDGRSYLAGTSERYDVIVGDLFTPWHAGTGSLYTLEHFRTVRARLRPGGLFAQWLPLYQLSEQEFLVIAQTLRAVFPQVTVWRGDFSAERPIVALVARADDAPLDHAALLRNAALLTVPARTGASEHMAGLFYAGNLSDAGAVPAGIPINTDDRPVLEYLSPRTRAGSVDRFVGFELVRFYDRLLAAVPPERDPILARLPAREVAFVRGGLAFYKYHVYRGAGRQETADRLLSEFLTLVPVGSPDDGSDSVPGWPAR